MNWLDAAEIYIQVEFTVNLVLGRMFAIVDNVSGDLTTAVTASAMIYIALLGYSIMSGAIAMSARDITMRLAKVVAIILLITLIGGYGGDFYELIWEPVDGIGDYLVEEFAPILGVLGVGNIHELAAAHSGLASALSSEVSTAQKDSAGWGIITWVIAMAPLILMLVGIYVAKIVSAMLLIVAPIVFIAALLLDNSRGNSIAMTWFRMVAMTFLSVIFLYIIGLVGVVMTGGYIGTLLGTNAIFGTLGVLTDPAAAYSLPRLAPMGILALLSVILISQATTIAGGLLSVAGIQTQTAQSMMQIGALNAAKA